MRIVLLALTVFAVTLPVHYLGIHNDLTIVTDPVAVVLAISIAYLFAHK